MQMTNIPKKEQEGVLHSFWVMMKECEEKVDNDNCRDFVLKNQVEGFFKQWSRITDSDHAPVWIRREMARKSGEEILAMLVPSKEN